MNIKKIFTFLLLLILTINTLFSSTTLANTSENTESELNSIKISEIDNYPELKKSLIDNGYYELIETSEARNLLLNDSTKTQTYTFSPQPYKTLEPYEIIGVSKEDYDNFNELFGYPKKTLIEEEFILYKQTKNMNTLSYNTWYIKYGINPLTNAFQMTMYGLGTDPIDSVVEFVDVYALNSSTWTKRMTASVTKTNITNGLFYTLSPQPLSVAEYFNYHITLREDGSTWVYHNDPGTSNHTYWKRFHFAVGPFNQLDSFGGERHHVVSKAALVADNRNPDTAIAMRMTKKDHSLTYSHGNSYNAQNFRELELEFMQQKKYAQLIQLEMNSFKEISDPDGFGTLYDKYYNALMVAYSQLRVYFGI